LAETLVHQQNFESFKESLVLSKLQKDTTLRSETARHWLVLQEDRAPLHFNRERAEAEAVSDPPLPPSLPLLCALRSSPPPRKTYGCGGRSWDRSS
jgi:hypothetical protein